MRPSLGPHNALWASGLWARIGHMIALAIVTDNKHWATVAVAVRLVGSERRRVSALRGNVSHAFAETTMAKSVRTAKEFDRIVGIVRSQRWLHSAEVLITQG